MRQHCLKIERSWFERLLKGEKTHELRINDRDYQVGDELVFTSTDDRVLSDSIFTITHVLPSDACDGLMHGYCILSLKRNDT